MNNKVYRLLRNNKEQGPYTADELIQKNLKPFDLIWIDGRSAAWNYPTEIAEFKLYVPEAFEKPAGNLKVSTAAQVSASVQAVVSINDAIKKTEEPKQKPRYKISAAWSKIQTIVPGYKDVLIAEPKQISSSKIINSTKTQPVNTKSLSWEQAWLDWEHEKNSSVTPKPVSIQENTTVSTTKNKHLKSEPVLEKKFEQSLDTITNNYIDSLLQQKKKPKSINLGKTSEFLLPSLALIVIFGIAYWLMHNTKVTAVPNNQPENKPAVMSIQNNKNTVDIKKGTTKNIVTASIEIPVKNINANPVKSNEIITKKPSPERYVNTSKFIEPVKKSNTDAIADNYINQQKRPTITDADLKKVKPVTKQFEPSVSIINNVPKGNVYNNASASNNGDMNAVENRPVKRRTDAADAADNSGAKQTVAAIIPGLKNTNTNPGHNYVSVPEYIAINDGSGNIKIQNTSDVDLDLAVIDVQYYDASGRFRKGETLYLHNLKAGKAVNIKTAKDSDAAYATSKVSLVSSDANGVYAVGDN